MGMHPGTAVLTLLPLLLLFAVIDVPFMILNGIIAERKGKDRAKYILLSPIWASCYCFTSFHSWTRMFKTK